MKNLIVRKIRHKGQADPDTVSHILEKKTINHYVDTLNWKSFPCKPKVSFRIGFCGDEIWLKYNVIENYILARETRINGAVYKDSCVEFFISFDKTNYYNFEFNCIGVTHLAYGSGRNSRRFIETEIIKQIKIESSLGNEPFEEKQGEFSWEMTIIIPKTCFTHENQIQFTGLKAYANFYKCGDGTSEPHYLTWNPVLTLQPDYHRPEYFGIINFE